LVGRIARDWVVTQTLLITIERDNGSFIASDDVFAMYGLGKSIEESVFDYISVLTEYYDVLSAHNDAPSVALFRHLQTYLQTVHR
jgi:flagellum-specific peptidoglycan hydrolase FlgJ